MHGLAMNQRKLKVKSLNVIKIKYIIVCIIFFTTTFHAHQSDIYQATRHNAQEHCKAIEAMIYRHQLIKGCLSAGAFIATSIHAYNTLYHFFESIVLPEQSCISLEINFFQGLSYIAFYGAIRQVVLSALTNYAFHPDTIDWYVQTYVPYKNTSTLIQEYVFLIKQMGYSISDSYDFYKNSIKKLSQHMAYHCEKIVGYVLYIQGKEHEQFGQEYALIASCLLDTINTWLDTIASLSLDSENECNIYITKTAELENKISRVIEHAKVVSYASVHY